MKQVNLYSAKTHLSRLVDEVEKGAEIIIARNGRPVVKLVPLEPTQKERRLDSLKGKVKIGANFDAPLPKDLAKAFGL